MKQAMKVLTALGVLGFANQVLAAHSDLHVSVISGAISVGGDELVVDALTGYQIFEGDFGDLEGGPYKTDDPGFLADSGNFLPGTILGYRAQGTLQYWNGSSWGAVAGQERVYLTDAFEEDSIFALSGVSGKTIGLIDQVGSDGVLHAHVDYSIENSLGVGNPSIGAYLIQLSVVALDENFNQASTYGESQPFYVVFNRGLSSQAFESAIDARVEAVPIPAAGPLLGSVLALGFGVARRRRARNV